eukprot:Gb_39796 [translate_table: standard]
MESGRPENVGILGMEIYFPRTCVKQEALEAYDEVSKGKYTIGLGQECMSFCTDLEDVISMSLTAVSWLLEKYGVDPKEIGRLEVGSETVIDKSKSIKTWLMQIFEECGNSDIEGVDSSNACYGGTAALFNCVNWVESSCWDGRYGLVVSTDSAVYAEGSARPTGGAGAVAMLIGPNAPIAFESKLRGSHMAHAYDFYKPDLSSEYPVVDGMLSQKCYLMALDACYKRFCDKAGSFSLADADYLVFHSPYNKLVQKSFARLLFDDFKADPCVVGKDAREKLEPFAGLSDEESYSSQELEKVCQPYNKLVQKSFARLLFDDFKADPCVVGKDAREKLEPFAGLSDEESYSSRELEKVCQHLAKPLYDAKVVPATLLPKQVGNMYTASLYAALASLIHNKRHSLVEGQRVLMFSYGSGLTSTMFSLRIRNNAHPIFTLSNIAHLMDLSAKLSSRNLFSPQDFVLNMKVMESRYGAKDFVPSSQLFLLRPGTFYLTHVDSRYRRFYARNRTAHHASSNGHDHSI